MNLFVQQPPNPALRRSRSPSPAPTAVPPMKFQEDEILHSTTNQPIFTVTAEKSILSGKKKAFTLTQHWTARPMGSFRFSSLESKIEYDVNGAANRLDGDMLTGTKFSTMPLSFPGRTWQWKRKGEKFTLTDDAGATIATVVDGNLVLEPLGFRDTAVDEIVLCAYAVWQKRLRDKGDGKEAEAVGEVLGAVLGG